MAPLRLHAGNVIDIFSADTETALALPFVEEGISAGFPSLMLDFVDPYATNSTIELSKFAIQALKRIFIAGYPYKKAGVIVQDFTPENRTQTTLFESRNERHIPLMQTIDQLNARFGQQKIRLASQDPKRVWKMKQEKLSPRYTTDLNDIIVINL